MIVAGPATLFDDPATDVVCGVDLTVRPAAIDDWPTVAPGTLRVLTVDPGSSRSAVVRALYAPHAAPPWGIVPCGGEMVENEALRFAIPTADALCIEAMATLYTSNAAAELLATERWCGRIIESFLRRNPAGRVAEISSSTAKTAVCGTTRAKDPDVRRGLIDAYGGDAWAFGRKCERCKGRGEVRRAPCPDCATDPGWNPSRGPCHGWTGTHLFRALAVAWAGFLPGGPLARRSP